jgi:hypothetical protein
VEHHVHHQAPQLTQILPQTLPSSSTQNKKYQN